MFPLLWPHQTPKAMILTNFSPDYVRKLPAFLTEWFQRRFLNTVNRRKKVFPITTQLNSRGIWFSQTCFCTTSMSESFHDLFWPVVLEKRILNIFSLYMYIKKIQFLFLMATPGSHDFYKFAFVQCQKAFM
jgi:hypothetical protein